VSRFDDLDELEREVGSSVRVALRRAAASIADDAPAKDLDRAGAEVPVVDLEAAPEARPAPRRWRLAAAAVAALVLVLGGVLVWAASSDDAHTPAPAGPGTTSTTVPPAALQAFLPPEGAPSTPLAGELVASIGFWGPGGLTAAPAGWGDTSLNLFADGRLIRLPTRGVPGGMGEQRLTPEGVERVRSQILATVFGGGRQPADSVWSSCFCIIRVRDGGRVLSTAVAAGPDADRADPQVGRFVEWITTLESSLPPSAWQDRDVAAFVPLRYRICVYGEDAETNLQPFSDVPGVVARRLPARVARLLAGINPCLELPTADARTLARWLVDAGLRHDAWSPRLHFTTPWSSDAVPGSVAVDLAPLLPDGKPASWDPN
jgi:hypothetical protein